MKRILIYFSLVVAFILAIIFKIGIIKEKEAAEVASILGEWQRDGIPVEAFEVIRRDMVRTEKLTGEVKSTRLLEAAVSASLTRSLSSGDKVQVLTESGPVDGTVRSVAKSAGPTGLYRVEMRLNSGLSLPPGSSLPVDVEVDRLRQRLVVPSTSLRTDEGKTYVWKLINNAAERVEVTTGPTSGQLVEIRQGLSEGDLVVVRGQSNLQSDMGVQIIGNL